MGVFTNSYWGQEDYALLGPQSKCSSFIGYANSGSLYHAGKQLDHAVLVCKEQGDLSEVSAQFRFSILINEPSFTLFHNIQGVLQTNEKKILVLVVDRFDECHSKA